MKRDTLNKKRDTVAQDADFAGKILRNNSCGDPDWIRTSNLPLRREPFIALFLL